MSHGGIANKINKIVTRAITAWQPRQAGGGTVPGTTQPVSRTANRRGGMIAGTGGHSGLIADDLFPDRKHAESQVFRDTVHDCGKMTL